VTGLGELGVTDAPESLVLPPSPRPRADTIACASDTILALEPAHLSMAEVAGPIKAC
jgi:hypothetical protein